MRVCGCVYARAARARACVCGVRVRVCVCVCVCVRECERYMRMHTGLYGHLEADPGREIACRTGDSNPPRQYRAWPPFSGTSLPTDLFPPQI